MNYLQRIVLLASLGLSATLHAENVVHISSSGQAGNTGSASSPVLSFKSARDTIRAIRQNDQQKRKEHFTVIVHPGTYSFKETLELGAKEYNTTWKAAEPNSVFITGGIDVHTQEVLPLNEREKARIITPAARGEILKIDLTKAGVRGDLGTLRQRGFARPYQPMQSELSIDGKAQTLARWPNLGDKNVRIAKVIDKGSIPRNGDYSNRGGVIQFDPDRIKQWKDAPDVWIYGHFSHGYADDSVKIKEIDVQKKTIKTVQPTRYGFMSGAGWRSFHGYNLFEEIDQPGEYYIDRKTRILYFYPPVGFNPKTSQLSLSFLRTPMVAIENTHDITLRGFTFENTCGMGVYMEESKNCIVDQCTLRNIGLVAVVIGNGVEASEGSFNEFHSSIKTRPATKRVLGSLNGRIYSDTSFQRRGGSKNAVTNSDIYDIGCGGIHIGGGDFKTLKPAENRVENCHIHHVNRVEKTYRSAVNLDGVGQIVRHNLIEDITQSAIYFHGNDHLIEYNQFNRCMTYGDDMGVIYYGRNPAELGTTIRYNFFQDCARGHTSNSPVIYADDGACNLTVHGNLFVRCGANFTTLLGGGSFHRFYNNCYIQCAPALRIGNRLQTWSKGLLKKNGLFETRLKAVNSDQGAFAKRYPFIKDYMKNNPRVPHANEFTNNILWSTSVGGNTKLISLRQNLITRTNPGFKNPSVNDWSLNLSPEARKVLGSEFKMPDFEKMGLYIGKGRQSLPFGNASITPKTAFFFDTMKVTLHTPKNAAGVVYTLDGTIPDSDSKRYTSPIEISAETTVIARAIGKGKHPSLTESVRHSFIAVDQKRVVAQINFQSANAKTPDGWLADSGKKFQKQSQGKSYGWTAPNEKSARKRGKISDPLSDTLVHFTPGVAWEMAIPNGQYRVISSVGDSEFHSSKAVLQIEGKSVIANKSLKAREFEISITDVSVSDGKLTLSSDESKKGSELTRINYVIITRQP